MKNLQVGDRVEIVTDRVHDFCPQSKSWVGIQGTIQSLYGFIKGTVAVRIAIKDLPQDAREDLYPGLALGQALGIGIQDEYDVLSFDPDELKIVT